jgi:RimJ/RimL family protein N-acetyltransferase
MSLGVFPETWEAKLPTLIPTHEVEKLKSYYYLCRAVEVDWREHIPAEYTIKKVDRAVFESASDTFTDTLRDWDDIEQKWRSVNNFLEKGVSFVALHEGQAVAWCTPDCVADNKIEVGIVTDPAHRRRGLATAVVGATVEHCLDHGFRSVGWHCLTDNVGSWKTAEKVGFERDREYTDYNYIFDPVDHLAELGWFYFKQGEFDRTTQYYEQVFARRDDNPDYYYHLSAVAWAALGDVEKALLYLNAAVDHGWVQVEYTEQVEAFELLHRTAEWGAVLSRMEKAADGA